MALTQSNNAKGSDGYIVSGYMRYKFDIQKCFVCGGKSS